MNVKEAEKFGHAEERKLLSCLDSAVSLVSSGMTPDSALAKSAKDKGLHPNSVPLAVQAYNVGQQTYQREKCAGEGTSCLLGEHPIARIENVESLLYPNRSEVLGSRKAAALEGVSDDYSRPPTAPAKYQATRLEKAASQGLPSPEPLRRNADPTFYINRCIGAKQASEQIRRNLRLALITSKDEMNAKIAEVRNWCRKNSTKVAEVEWNSRQLFGTGTRELFDHATNGLTGLERAEGRPYTAKQAVDSKSEPYNLVKAALDKVIEYIQDTETVKAADAKIAREVAEAIPFGPGHEPKSWVLAGAAAVSSMPQKSAGPLSNIVTSTLGNVLGTSMFKPKAPGDIVSGMGEELDDPAHDAQMRAIKAKAMLSDLMANDDVIGSADPGEVTNAYNELAQLGPHMTDQYGIMRGALRKRLESSGGIESFDADQLRKLDSTFVAKPPYESQKPKL